MNKLSQVLIVDDDEVNNLFCKIVIEHSGISGDVHYCMSGPEALDYLSMCIKSGANVPDLILLDINMPFMNGFDFLNLYNEFGYHEQLHTKISMLSSSDVESDVKTAMKYKGVIDYVTKPLSEEALNRVLQKLDSAA
ncbi:response regulator [Pontibacter sp. KCTC 32443]|uniref:response regulator n=1 Tax=Pontibacter TaxID=323449 RepID=UPI00164D542E|nr:MULTISPECIES: response regulator [Pontibacter]MBC5774628.1 response regulator [Pontibacter sp. KCTC 32443]